MDEGLINLLPLDQQRALSRAYLLRFSVMVISAVSALVVTAGLLLVPTYVFLTQSMETKQAALAHIQDVLSSADENDLSAHLAALSNNAATLVALGNGASVSPVIRAALAVSRPGIKLSGLVYAPAVGNNPRTLTISGTAATRDALRSYQLALQGAPFASAANLPVSAYAKDADITFSITVILAP